MWVVSGERETEEETKVKKQPDAQINRDGGWRREAVCHNADECGEMKQQERRRRRRWWRMCAVRTIITDRISDCKHSVVGGAAGDIWCRKISTHGRRRRKKLDQRQQIHHLLLSLLF